MRIFSLMVLAVMLAGCGMNASNSDAPKADQAHEALWVANHRGAILNFANYTTKNSNGETVVDGVIIQEIAKNQCGDCHGPNLAGPRESDTRYKNASDCLSCHVLDPIKYPVMCYSCHGGWPIVPLAQYTSVAGRTQLRNSGWPVQPLQQWFSTSRAKRGGMAIDQNFVTRVRTTNVHLKHDAIPALPFDATLAGNTLTRNEECRRCHGYYRQDNLGTRHHNRMNQRQGVPFVFNSASGPITVSLGGCLAPLSRGGCHTLNFGGNDPFSPLDCLGCHARPVSAPH